MIFDFKLSVRKISSFLDLMQVLINFCFSIFRVMSLIKRFFILLIIDFSQSSKTYLNINKVSKFVCEIVKDESKNNKNMKTVITFLDHNQFPEYFLNNMFKCFPKDIAKVILQPIELELIEESKFSFHKSSMVVYISDVFEKVR